VLDGAFCRKSNVAVSLRGGIAILGQQAR